MFGARSVRRSKSEPDYPVPRKPRPGRSTQALGRCAGPISAASRVRGARRTRIEPARAGPSPGPRPGLEEALQVSVGR